MEGKTAKPIQSITPPPETENVNSLEIEWDIRRLRGVTASDRRNPGLFRVNQKWQFLGL